MVRSPGPRVTGLAPAFALPGGRVTVTGRHLLPSTNDFPVLSVGSVRASVVRAAPHAVTFIVPEGTSGCAPVRLEGAEGESALLEVGRLVATGLHQVDSPVFDQAGVLYVTYSGARGEEAPVSVYRVPPDGIREAFVTGLSNATSLAFDAAGRLHVSSRFEGTVSRIGPDGAAVVVASDLGTPCGLAFDDEGRLLVGDRSGHIWRVPPGEPATLLAELPPSVAAFHLALDAHGSLYVTGPTLSTYDALYRVTRDGEVTTVRSGFGRPQGLAIGPDQSVYVVEALAGVSGVYRLSPSADRGPRLIASGPNLVGVAFDPRGGWVVASQDSVYRFDALPDPA